MAMQQGFGATQEAAPPQNTGDPLLSGTGIFHLSNKEGQNRRTVCLIDDSPVWGYRHKIQRPYNPTAPSGDWRERDIRVTCAVSGDGQDHPKECLICEAAIRHGELIKRRFTANLTLIDEGEHRTKKGNVYHDLKKMLEIDWTYYKAFEEQKKAIPGGTLAGMRFSVLRPPGDAKQTKTFGNVWTPLGVVNPMQHFWNSPAVRAIAEMAAKRGERLSQQDAVTRLVSRIDYTKELDNYTPQIAERFLARALAKNYTASQENDGGGGFYQPGPGNPIGQQGAPTMPSHAAPDYTPAPQGFQGAAPMGAPASQWGPPQGQPMGAPMGFPQGAPPVGNPPQATMPNAMMPQGQPQWGPPQGQPQPQFAPMPQAQPQPQQQNYGFEQAPGWSPTFPGAQNAAQAPQGQPGQAMQGPPQGFQPMQPQQSAPQGFPQQGQQGPPPQPQAPNGQRIPPPPASRPF